MDIFPNGLTHGFGPKMAIFPTFIFQQIYPKKMSFMIFQIEKMPFQTIKTRSLKTRKIDIFPKGLTGVKGVRGFGPKMAIFPTFIFQEIQARKMSFTIFQNEKTPLQVIKTISSKSRRINILTEGVNPWFWSKNANFSNFFFRQCRPRIFLLRYSTTKKRLFRLQKQEVQKVQKLTFFQRD